MGGLSSEREVSISTGNSVCEAMIRMGLNIYPIDVDQNIVDKLQHIDSVSYTHLTLPTILLV